VDVDLAALRPPIACCRSRSSPAAGPSCGRSQLDTLPEAGNFRGAVSFDAPASASGAASLTLDLDFRDDGTIVGRVDNDASLLWPQPLALTGTWNAAGDVTIELRDRLPAEAGATARSARELGRELTLTGKRTATGLEGTATETITGLRAAPVPAPGALFALHRQGPLTGIVHAPDFIPKDATAPTWLAPPGLDTEACDDLGDRLRHRPTLPEPSPRATPARTAPARRTT
jgi:hypothetical protein